MSEPWVAPKQVDLITTKYRSNNKNQPTNRYERQKTPVTGTGTTANNTVGHSNQSWQPKHWCGKTETIPKEMKKKSLWMVTKITNEMNVGADPPHGRRREAKTIKRDVYFGCIFGPGFTESDWGQIILALPPLPPGSSLSCGEHVMNNILTFHHIVLMIVFGWLRLTMIPMSGARVYITLNTHHLAFLSVDIEEICQDEVLLPYLSLVSSDASWKMKGKWSKSLFSKRERERVNSITFSGMVDVVASLQVRLSPMLCRGASTITCRSRVFRLLGFSSVLFAPSCLSSGSTAPFV